jgi:queuine/archaeosine tRNA-ribosyltransferase
MLNPIEILGGEMDATLERATIVTPAIMPVGANRVPAVAVVGFESIAIVNINKYALAGFTRAKTWAAEA